MTQTQSKSRQKAELALALTQTQFFARGHAVEEMDSITQARDAKTMRLREARLSKEAKAIATASAGLIARRARKA
ncbi:hypothetical protein AAIH46_13385 [Rhizobium sp. 0TCS1.26]|uniref:hypothetical protein n=1 Tax=Rhizobium sp. 0TCS1.26 TaxID=3142623 RepID=UPI003D2B5AF0